MLIMRIKIDVLAYSLLFLLLSNIGIDFLVKGLHHWLLSHIFGTVWQQSWYVPPCVIDLSFPCQLQSQIDWHAKVSRPYSTGVRGLGKLQLSISTDPARPPSVLCTKYTFLCQQAFSESLLVLLSLLRAR
jgi:hypothetical protein